jgi:hypothetical protein
MNKQMTAADVVARLRDGMTIGFGGWGPRRKPMAIVREILRSPLRISPWSPTAAPRSACCAPPAR